MSVIIYVLPVLITDVVRNNEITLEDKHNAVERVLLQRYRWEVAVRASKLKAAICFRLLRKTVEEI